MPTTPRQRHGVTTQTADHFLVDAGAAYINFDLPDERLLGATRGGNSFTIEQDVREPEIDGIPGPLKGTRRVVEMRPTLTINLLEITLDNLLIAIAGATATPTPDETAATHDIVTRSRNIVAADYIENIALVGTISGSDEPIIIMIKNALQTDNFELGTEDREEGVLALTLTGHFDPADMRAEPWEIHFPRNSGLQSGTPDGETTI